MKKSIEVHCNRSKICLLYFSTHLKSICEKKTLAEVWLIDADQTSLHNFIIFWKKNRQSWRLNNLSKILLNQWESMGFHKLKMAYFSWKCLCWKNVSQNTPFYTTNWFGVYLMDLERPIIKYMNNICQAQVIGMVSSLF